jgi:hypothetical protein
MATVRIPKGFYQDHCERDLPAPVAIKETKSHVFLDTNDAKFTDLLDDAMWYAKLNSEGRDDPAGPTIKQARALLKHLGYTA